MCEASGLLDARILVVDDREVDVRLIDSFLRGGGYTRVDSTSDPTAVAELVRANGYDLIILDLMMPGMDGFAVMEELAALEAGAYLPILAVTADPAHMLRALASGARDFLSKPLHMAKVLARVHNMLEVGALLKKLKSRGDALETSLRERTAALSESEELFRLFATHLPGGIFIRGVKEKVYRYVNPAYEKLVGRRIFPGDSLDKGLAALHQEDREAVRKQIDAQPHGGMERELRFVHADGEKRWAHVRSFPIADSSGGIAWVGGTLEDITERKIIEAALHDSESRFRALVEQSIAGIYVVDDGRFSYVNPRMCEILGYSREELRTIPTISIVVEEDRVRMAANRLRADAGDPAALMDSYHIRRKDGEVVILGLDGRIIEHDGRQVLLGIAQDVTEQVRAQGLLAQAESHYRALVEQSLVGICIVMEGRIFYANPLMCELSGYTLDEIARKSFEELLLLADDWPVFHAILERRRRGETGSIAWRCRLQRKDGDIRDLSVESKLIELAGGTATFAIVQDVTERERAAAAHRESEEKYRLLWETTTDVVLIVGEDLRIQFANPALRDVFGHEPSEIEGKDVVCLFPPHLREAYASVVRRYIETGVRTLNWRATEVKGWHSDGHAVPLEVAFGHVSVGQRSMFAVFMRDITQRKHAQAALETANERLQVLSKRVLSVQEEERRGISRELHDDVGQSLLALRMGLHRLEGHVDARQEGLLGDCVSISDAIQEKLRELSVRLVPPQLEQLGLQDALRWLASQQRNLTGLAIACRFGTAGRFPVEIESACYRICQEALNNATRHATARQVDVELDADGESLILTIRDDGCGFEEHEQRAKALRSGSLGLIGMEERARLAGGRLELRTAPAKGTSVFAFFPLAAATSKEPLAQQARTA